MKRILAGFLAFTALCWVVVGGLVARWVPGGGLGVLGLALLATAPILVLVRGFTRGAYPGRAMRLFVVRPFWYVQLLLPVAMGAALAGAAIGGGIGLFRGDTVATAATGGRVALAVAVAIAVVVLLAGYADARRLVVRRYEARSPTLPAGFDGMRIVQLSDLHVGPHTSRRMLTAIARRTREEEPELIALTGDLVDDYARDTEAFERGLGRFAAPLGVYAIPGNHDVFAGWEEVRPQLEAQGMCVLVNEAVPIERGGDRIAVLGTGDPAGAHFHRRGGAAAAPDLGRAVHAARTLVGDDGFVLALAHNPALWPALAQARVGLTLSGHTHWGQLAIPSARWSLASPFLELAMGSYVRSAAVLYVHPGTSYWGVPFRLGTPPEIAVITLRRGAAAFVSAD